MTMKPQWLPAECPVGLTHCQKAHSGQLPLLPTDATAPPVLAAATLVSIISNSAAPADSLSLYPVRQLPTSAPDFPFPIGRPANLLSGCKRGSHGLGGTVPKMLNRASAEDHIQLFMSQWRMLFE